MNIRNHIQESIQHKHSLEAGKQLKFTHIDRYKNISQATFRADNQNHMTLNPFEVFCSHGNFDCQFLGYKAHVGSKVSRCWLMTTNGTVKVCP